MKIVFMGTPDFAVPCIEALYNRCHEICAVYTQPDKPKGRGYTLTSPPVKQFALQHEIPVFQPEKLKNNDEVISQLNSFSPDVIVVVAYGKILPKSILDLPRFGCVNVHASILPKYRGAAPIQWAIINGEKYTGVTTMLMDVGLDTGDMLLSDSLEIDINENAEQLHDKLSKMGAELIVKTLDELSLGSLMPVKQKDELSCYAPMLDRSLSEIDWNDSAFNIHNKVRGLYPWPSAYTTVNGKKLKVLQTHISEASGAAGQVISTSPFIVGCGSQSIEILEVQPDGKRKMSVSDFLRGIRFDIVSLGN